MEVASVLEATVVLEATAGTEARAMHSAPPALEPAPVSPDGVDRGGEDRGGEDEGQHPHEPETDDLLHGRLLPGGLHRCEVSPPWRLERGSARLTYCIVTLQTSPWIPVFTFHGLDMQIERSVWPFGQRAARQAAAVDARRCGEAGDAYRHDLPQLNTVGYLTTTAGALAAGYAQFGGLQSLKSSNQSVSLREIRPVFMTRQ
jgi:hypothetical protein